MVDWLILFHAQQCGDMDFQIHQITTTQKDSAVDLRYFRLLAPLKRINKTT